jgi:hyperosmotically inducible periplasmic protein
MRALSLLLISFLIVPLLVAQGNSDGRIHDEVMAKLASDTDVRGGGFDVAVKDGMVTIKGEVRSQKAKEKAEKLTKKIKGVISVDNQLKIFGTD